MFHSLSVYFHFTTKEVLFLYKKQILPPQRCFPCKGVALFYRLTGLHRLQRLPNQLVQAPAQHIGTALNYLAGAARCKLLVLVLFLDGFHFPIADTLGRAHQRRRADQPCGTSS